MKIIDIKANYGIEKENILNYLENINKGHNNPKCSIEYSHRVNILHKMSDRNIIEFNNSRRCLDDLMEQIKKQYEK